MAEQELLIRSSMRNLMKKEQEAGMFKQKLNTILRIPMTIEMREKFAMSGLHMTNGDISDAITASLVLQAMNGNIAAYTTIRDTMGFKPIEQTKSDVIVRIDMSPVARELGE